MEFYRKHAGQDPKKVIWSSVFHHELVFTMRKKCVLFIYIVEYRTFLCKNIFSLPARNYEAKFGLAIKTREGFLRKNIVAVSFFQNCAIHQYS